MQSRNRECLAVMMWRMTTACGLFGGGSAGVAAVVSRLGS
jgi:hypothetical protein